MFAKYLLLLTEKFQMTLKVGHFVPQIQKLAEILLALTVSLCCLGLNGMYNWEA